MDAIEQFDRSLTRILERDPRWQLVQRIIATPGIARAPRLVSFLVFVSERCLIGNAEAINEQSIGVGVFERKSGYDSNDDNIVRSHASRLRQKLDAYFQNEGSGERLRISIPKGCYVPTFYEVPEAELALSDYAGGHPPEHPGDPYTDNRATRQDAPQPASPSQASSPLAKELEASLPVRTATPRRYWLLGSAACLLCIAATYSLAGNWRHKVPPPPVAPNHALWQELLGGRENTLIVTGDSSLVLYENITGKTLSIGEYISGSYRDDTSTQTKIDPQMLRIIAHRRLTSVVDQEISNRIMSRVELLPNHAIVRYARDVHIDDLKGVNVILIGSREANPWVQLYSESLNFTLIPNQQSAEFTIHNRAPKAGEAAEYLSLSATPERRAYAIVAFLKNLNGSGHALIIQGTGMAGTEAAADYLLRENQLRTLLHVAPGSTDLPGFEILLETSSLNGSAPKSKLVAVRVNGQ